MRFWFFQLIVPDFFTQVAISDFKRKNNNFKSYFLCNLEIFCILKEDNSCRVFGVLTNQVVIRNRLNLTVTWQYNFKKELMGNDQIKDND